MFQFTGDIKMLMTIAVLSVWFKGVTCLYCLSCDNIPRARDCPYVKKCGPHEVCFAEQVVSDSGRIFRRIGCRDVLRCQSGSQNHNGEIVVCSKCCNSTTGFCQTSLCNDKPYEHIGPLCFNCDNLRPGDDCNRIKPCGRDEVCYEGVAPSFQQDFITRSGCYSKLACDRIGNLAIGKRQNDFVGNPHCWRCCDTFLCNNNCGYNHTSAATTTSLPGPVHGGVTVLNPGTACIDGTPASTCKLAASVVCTTSTKASNADCMHYCGFC